MRHRTRVALRKHYSEFVLLGGTTLSFDLWPGHPFEADVRRLLADVRNQIIPLWEKVEEHNKANPPEPSCKVSFYCGQHLAYSDGDA